MSARLRVALRDLVNLLSTVGLDVVEEAGDIDPTQLLGVPSHSKTSPEAVQVGRSVPALELPAGLKQVAVLTPSELWPDLLNELVEAQDKGVNGHVVIRLLLWKGRAVHPEITRMHRRPSEGRHKSPSTSQPA